MATSRASASPSSTTDLTEGHEWYEEEASPSGGSSDRKAHTLFLTEDEKKLLAEEGITLPTDMPLTKVLVQFTRQNVKKDSLSWYINIGLKGTLSCFSPYINSTMHV